jgi:hypothetical protein
MNDHEKINIAIIWKKVLDIKGACYNEYARKI